MFGGALCLRLIYLADVSDSPTFLIPIVDSEIYDRAARSLAEGQGFTEAFFYQPFFYPFVLSLLYRAFGSSVVIVKILQSILGAITCGAVCAYGSRVFDRRTGVAAGAITALCGPLVFFDGELLATCWAALWSILLVWLFTVAERSSSPRLFFVLGLCGAVAIITRPTFLPFVVAGTVWLGTVLVRQRRSETARVAIAFGAGFLLVVLPVAAQSAATMNRFTPLPASGGLNLYLGNNPDVCETLTVRPGKEWEDLVSRPAGSEGRDLWTIHEYFLGETIDYARNDPAGFVTGIAVKTAQFWNGREIPRNLDMYLFRRWSLLLRGLVWKWGNFGFPFAVILALAVFGAVSRWRDLPWPLILYLVLYPLAVIVVFVSARYRAPVVPVLAVLAAVGITSLVEAVRQRWPRRSYLAGAAAAAALLFAVVPGPFCQETDLEAEYWFLAGAGHLRHGDKDAAVAALQRSVSLEPDYFEAQYTLGSLLLERGHLKQAVSALWRAVREDPGVPVAHRELGLALGRLGRFEESLDQLQQALALDPSDPRVRNSLGALLFEMGRYREAEQHLETALELDPSYRAAQENLARVRSVLRRGESFPDPRE